MKLPIPPRKLRLLRECVIPVQHFVSESVSTCSTVVDRVDFQCNLSTISTCVDSMHVHSKVVDVKRLVNAAVGLSAHHAVLFRRMTVSLRRSPRIAESLKQFAVPFKFVSE
jgi:putative aminopeptidase FrvX